MDKRLTLLYRYTENCHEPLNIQIKTSNLLQTKCKSSQIKSPGTLKVQSVRKHTVGEGKLCVCENFCVFSEQRKVMDSRPACDQDNWKQNKLLKSIQKQIYIYIYVYNHFLQFTEAQKSAATGGGRSSDRQQLLVSQHTHVLRPGRPAAERRKNLPTRHRGEKRRWKQLQSLEQQVILRSTVLMSSKLN